MTLYGIEASWSVRKWETFVWVYNLKKKVVPYESRNLSTDRESYLLYIFCPIFVRTDRFLAYYNFKLEKDFWQL